MSNEPAHGRPGRGGRRYRPYAFTEQGVAMLSCVLNSDRAIAVNIAIMRAFVRLRQLLATHRDLAEKLQAMEKKYDKRFTGGSWSRRLARPAVRLVSSRTRANDPCQVTLRPAC